MNMKTFSGKFFCLADFGNSISNVDIVDIAHHLSIENRFCGATDRPYSVAEHCVRMARVASKLVWSSEFVKLCLLHDCEEAYYKDLHRPAKELQDNHKATLARELILRKFNLWGAHQRWRLILKDFDEVELYVACDLHLGLEGLDHFETYSDPDHRLFPIYREFCASHRNMPEKDWTHWQADFLEIFHNG